VERARIEHPFLTFEWARSFWEAFGTGAQLRIVVVRERAEVVAIAPLMLVEERVCGVRLRLLCSLANDHTPRYGFIVPGAREDAYAAIWGELAGRRAEWDALRLIQLAAGSRTLERIARAAQADGFLVGLWPSSVSPFVVPRGSFEGYLAALPRQHRGNLRTRLRRLAELGPVAREVVASGPLGPALDEGLAIEASSWKGPAGTAILGSAETRAFYAALAARAAERGWLRLEFLSVAGRRIAFDYSLRYARRHFLLKTAYDPAFARYSPYNLLCAQNLAECFEQRLLEFDFLGDAADWKERWARESRAHYWLFVLPERPLMRALHALKFSLLPRLQRIPGYLRLRDALAAAGAAEE
jgi:CelD/BcsL family acetyltransferase involved in cellulose biosynthesis